jgi:hypothetical protein
MTTMQNRTSTATTLNGRAIRARLGGVSATTLRRYIGNRPARDVSYALG